MVASSVVFVITIDGFSVVDDVNVVVSWLNVAAPVILPFTDKLPAIVVVELVPAAIVTSNSPAALPSVITRPSVKVPLCEATESVILPPFFCCGSF